MNTNNFERERLEEWDYLEEMDGYFVFRNGHNMLKLPKKALIPNLDLFLREERNRTLTEVIGVVRSKKVSHTDNCLAPSGCEECAHNSAIDSVLDVLERDGHCTDCWKEETHHLGINTHLNGGRCVDDQCSCHETLQRIEALKENVEWKCTCGFTLPRNAAKTDDGYLRCKNCKEVWTREAEALKEEKTN